MVVLITRLPLVSPFVGVGVLFVGVVVVGGGGVSKYQQGAAIMERGLGCALGLASSRVPYTVDDVEKEKGGNGWSGEWGSEESLTVTVRLLSFRTNLLGIVLAVESARAKSGRAS
ncbi:hypothetical protein PoB_004777200 [Plakobranchus ocellatus]|uniref:Uncharacterized protein n=1 Tax=Plakobranchus ocellatus TaxID=259542 RepID=A0AAV4BPI6_9GAST|nr:hypothetical protein PoB_004777200 [Plakobranchus ocellatus]